MTSPKEFMVTRSSAERISEHVRYVDHLPSDSDHRDLVRFEHRQDGRYLLVIEKIRAIATHARSHYGREGPRTINSDRLSVALFLSAPDFLLLPITIVEIRRLSTLTTRYWPCRYCLPKLWMQNAFVR